MVAYVIVGVGSQVDGAGTSAASAGACLFMRVWAVMVKNSLTATPSFTANTLTAGAWRGERVRRDAGERW